MLTPWASALIDVELKDNWSQITTRKAIVFPTAFQPSPVSYYAIDNVPWAFLGSKGRAAFFFSPSRLVPLEVAVFRYRNDPTKHNHGSSRCSSN